MTGSHDDETSPTSSGASRKPRAPASTATNRAKDAIDNARVAAADGVQRGAERLDQAAHESSDTIARVRAQASQFASEAGEAARKAAHQGKVKAADALDQAARSVDEAARDVDDRWGDRYGDYARRTAQGLSSASETLRQTDFDAMMTDARDFVKRNPLIAVGAAAVVGFLLTRIARVNDTDA